MKVDRGRALLRLADGWIVINVVAGPTGDEPEVTLDVPSDSTHTSTSLIIRVAHVHAIHAMWSALGAEFLTIGALLTWGVHLDNSGVDINAIGAIAVGMGVGRVALSAGFWNISSGPISALLVHVQPTVIMVRPCPGRRSGGIEPVRRRKPFATGFLLWLIAVVLVIAGIVQLIRGQIILGIVLLIIGLGVGPGGFSFFRRSRL